MSMDFPRLESLRLSLEPIRKDQASSLSYFAYEQGFQHIKAKEKISVSSSATCVLSLVATGSWTAGPARTKELLTYLLSKKTSAGLPRGNPFTIAWILEAVTALAPNSDPLGTEDSETVTQMELILERALRGNKCGVKIKSYPPSAYLTQLVVRALRNRSKLTPDLENLVHGWAWAELSRQLALIQAKSKTADAFAVAYLIMLVTAVTLGSERTPEQTQIQKTALNTFFDCQLADGTWPLSRPLFHYEKFGNAYCYEYEMLTQLLGVKDLEDDLLEFLPSLSSAAVALKNSAYRISPGVRAWASGHHPQLGGPESWTTASVYHFAHMLDRLLAEAVRRTVFQYLEAPVPPSVAPSASGTDFASGFLDSRVTIKEKEQSLKHFIWEHFVGPLAAEAARVEDGHPFGKDTPRSAIFFGPPGTSKTELSRMIADFLGWPLLAIDPSHLLRNGMDGIQAEANTIFRMLEETERVVVLFDEFDELVRERGSATAQPFSRLLTTAMLPKLASIHRRATLVFIIATNNISEFDLAIRRPGRFDRILQVMPPTYDAKIAKKNWGPGHNIDLEARFKSLGVTVTEKIRNEVGELTFGECEAFAGELARATDYQTAIEALEDVWGRCTLRTPVSRGEETTWLDRSKADAQLNR